MSEPKAKKAKLPQPLKASELARMLEGSDALRKASLSLDNLLGAASLRRFDEVSAAMRIAEKSLGPGSALLRHMDEALRLHKQFEEPTGAKMLKAMSLPEDTLAKQINERPFEPAKAEFFAPWR